MFSDPRSPDPHRRRFRRIPLRMLVPNVITLLAICAGLTAIRLSFEGRNELALAAVVFAAMLDGIDGRVARMIKGQSRFGAELDSLADFVNFGVAPALILYFWQLRDLNNVGWIAAMIFAISGGLRLARFNAMMDDPNRPVFAANYFTGVPAPAGAICVLLPMYLTLIGSPQLPAVFTAFYTLLIAFLMVSRLPVFSGKMVGGKVEPEMVLPVVVLVVLFIAVLVSYPWHLLTGGSLLYLLCLPIGWWSYREQERRARAASGDTAILTEQMPDFTAPSGTTSDDERRTPPHRARAAAAHRHRRAHVPRHERADGRRAARGRGAAPPPAAGRRCCTATRRSRSTASTAASWRSTSRPPTARSSGSPPRRAPSSRSRPARAHRPQRVRRGRGRLRHLRPGPRWSAYRARRADSPPPARPTPRPSSRWPSATGSR